jgi:hypothetical protein
LAASCSYAQAAPRPVTASESLPRLLHIVMPLFVSVADADSAAPSATPDSHAVLALAALVQTPLSGSLCLVASDTAINLSFRRHQRALLRC